MQGKVPFFHVHIYSMYISIICYDAFAYDIAYLIRPTKSNYSAASGLFRARLLTRYMASGHLGPSKWMEATKINLWTSTGMLINLSKWQVFYYRAGIGSYVTMPQLC